MKDLSKVNRIFQIITGILFAAFGFFSLLNPVMEFSGVVWAAGAVGLFALIRLILICLPASSTFAGNSALEITTGVAEALFGLFFILNTLIYVEFLYSLIAILLLIMAVVRIRQSMLARKQGLNGWGSYLFMSILFFVLSAGLLLFQYGIKLDLQYELAGAAAFLYGFFLGFSSFYSTAAAGALQSEPPAQPVMEVPGEAVGYTEDLTTKAN